MSDDGDLLAELADVARTKGLTSVAWSCGETSVSFAVGPLPAPAQTPQTLLALSRPTGDPETGAERAEKQSRIAAYRDAVEGAHVHGYPNFADFGLTPGDVA